MNNDALDSVADSTDWLSTPLSGLTAVEAALRCQICKDFYRTPMLTSCNHTFCSLCIRRALSTDGKCPLCRASEQEMKLRSNWSMEEAVAAFTQMRSAVLEFARKPPSAPSRVDTPKRKADEEEDEEEQQRSNSQQRSSKRLRSSARLSKTRSMEATAEMARQEAHIPDPSPEPEPANVEPDDGLVACPICWRRMKQWQVYTHIDTSCPGAPQPDPTPPSATTSRRPSRPTSITNAFAPTSSSLTTTTTTTTTTTKFPLTQPQRPKEPPPDRLPALNYSMLRETQLRQELRDLGLPNTGNRGMLERRHREWVMIWNANCDSQRPRRRADLKHDLDVWERTLGSRALAATTSAGSGSAAGAQIRDKDFDGAAWAAKHQGSFRDLIADARRTRSRAAEAQSKPGESSEEEKTMVEPVSSTPPVSRDVAGRMVVDLSGDDDPPAPAPRIKVRGKEKECESAPI